MLLLDKTRITESFEYPVLASSMVTAEGQPVVADYTGGVFSVKPAAAAVGKFVGVTISQQISVSALPFFESVVAAATPATLSRTNLYVNTVRAVGSVTGPLTVVYAGAPTSGQVSINVVNGTATFHADQLGEVVELSYRYTPTTVEEKTVQGDITPGGSSAFILNSTGVITRGEIYTTEFSTLIDWATLASTGTVAVKNGLFVAYANDAAAIGDGATIVPGAVITSIPTAGFGVVGTGSNAVLGVKY